MKNKESNGNLLSKLSSYILLLPLLVFSNCTFDSSAIEGRECLGNQDCDNGYECIGGTCQLERDLDQEVGDEPDQDIDQDSLLSDDLEATGGNGVVYLTWTNPADEELAICELYRIEGAVPPEDRDQGELITTIDPAIPDAQESFDDDTVTNGVTYSYSLFCADSSDYWQESVQSGNTATATSNWPIPDNPADFSAGDYENRQTTVTFTMPNPPVESCDLYRLVGNYPNRTGRINPGTFVVAFSGDGPQEYVDPELDNGTTYYYAVYCHNNQRWNDNRGEGNSDTAIPKGPPPVVLDLGAEPVGDFLQLSWTNPIDLALHSCMLRRAMGNNPPANRDTGLLITTVDPAVLRMEETHLDETVTTRTTYSYTVFCRDNHGNWQNGVDAGNTVTATPGDMTPPGLVPNLEALGGNREVILTWNNPVDTDGDLHSCVLRRNFAESVGPPAYTGGELVETIEPALGNAPQRVVDSNVNPYVLYHYAVFCRDVVGNWQTAIADGNTASATPVDTTPPAAVTDLVAEASQHAALELVFTSPADEDLHSCMLRRLLGAAAPIDMEAGTLVHTFGPIDINTEVRHVDEPLLVGSTYSYSVFCRDHIGNWQDSISAGNTATQEVRDLEPPTRVTDLTATPGNYQITLNWTKPADTELHSCMLRRMDGDTPPGFADGDELVTISSVNLMSHVDGGLEIEAYTYAVFCRDGAGNWQTEVILGDNAVTATPIDLTPPAAVDDLIAEPGIASVTLRFTLPSDEDLHSCDILRVASDYPLDPVWENVHTLSIGEPEHIAPSYEAEYEMSLELHGVFTYTVRCRDIEPVLFTTFYCDGRSTASARVCSLARSSTYLDTPAGALNRKPLQLKRLDRLATKVMNKTG